MLTAGRTLTFFVIITGAIFSTSIAAVPNTVNYQGRLTDTLGQPLDTTIDLTFTIYDDSLGGSIIWTETHASVEISDGLFSLWLGTIDSLGSDIFTDPGRYLAITVGLEPEGIPRTRLAAVPYAFRVSTVDGATGGTIGSELTVDGRLRITGAAEIGPGHSVAGTTYFVAGRNNTIFGDASSIAGGESNHIDGPFGVIAGGVANYIAGEYASIPGGFGDTITHTADYSYLFGIGSILTQDSTFMVDLPHIRFGDEINGYEIPPVDGTAGQVMMTDGAGRADWMDPYSGLEIGWIDDGSVVRLETANDQVAIGITTPAAYPLTVRDGVAVVGSGGEVHGKLHAQSGAGHFTAYGPNGQLNAVIGYYGNGNEDFGKIGLYNSDISQTRSIMQVHPADYGEIILDGPGGVDNVYIGATAGDPSAGRIMVDDKAGIYEDTDGEAVVFGDVFELDEALYLYSSGGAERVKLNKSPNQSGRITTYGVNGSINVELGSFVFGTGDIENFGGIKIRDAIGQTRAEMCAHTSDYGCAIFRGPTSSVNVQIGSFATAPSHGCIDVRDASSIVRATMLVDDDGRGVITCDSLEAADRAVIGDVTAHSRTVTIEDGLEIRSNGDTAKADLYTDNGRGRLDIYGNNGSFNVVINDNDSGCQDLGAVHLKNGFNGNRAIIRVDDDNFGEISLLGPFSTSNVHLGARISNTLHGTLDVRDGGSAPKAGMYVDDNGHGVVWYSGSLACRTPHPDQPGTDIVYTGLEGPESAVYIRGTARLIDGRAEIVFPDHFRTLAGTSGMTVQLTPLAAGSRGLAVVEKGSARVVVRELMDGTGSYDFDYLITAVRAGHEDFRVIRPSSEVAANED